MKARLEFNLPEENGEFLAAQNGIKWKGVLCELDQWLRSIEKYGDDKTKSSDVRLRIFELMGEDNLQFDQ